MINMKKASMALVVFIFILFTAGASVKLRAEADLSLSGALNIPTAEYLENIGGPRPGFSAAADLNAGVKINNLSVTAGASVFFSSRTQTYQNLSLKGFTAFGPNIKVLYGFPSSRFTVSLKTRMLFCRFLNSQDDFLTFSTEAALGYRIGNPDKDFFSILVPVNMTYRKDVLSFSLGVGVSFFGEGR